MDDSINQYIERMPPSDHRMVESIGRRISTGFQPPEMVKRRQVVVVSPRRRHHSGLCLAVPSSTVVPDPVEAFHHLIPVGTYPFFHPQSDVWAKGDMLTCVAFRRLDRVLLNGRYDSARRIKTVFRSAVRHRACRIYTPAGFGLPGVFAFGASRDRYRAATVRERSHQLTRTARPPPDPLSSPAAPVRNRPASL